MQWINAYYNYKPKILFWGARHECTRLWIPITHNMYIDPVNFQLIFMPTCNHAVHVPYTQCMIMNKNWKLIKDHRMDMSMDNWWLTLTNNALPSNTQRCGQCKISWPTFSIDNFWFNNDYNYANSTEIMIKCIWARTGWYSPWHTQALFYSRTRTVRQSVPSRLSPFSYDGQFLEG